MNKLEEQIIEKAREHSYIVGGVDIIEKMVSSRENGIAKGILEGAQFVIDLELMEKFAEWVMTYYEVRFVGDTTLWLKGQSRSFPTGITYGALRKFWIENIYGR